MYKSSKKCFVWYDNCDFVVSVIYQDASYDVLFTSFKVPLRTKADVTAAFLSEFPAASVVKVFRLDPEAEVAFQSSSLQFRLTYQDSKTCNGIAPAVPGEPIKF